MLYMALQGLATTEFTIHIYVKYQDLDKVIALQEGKAFPSTLTLKKQI